MGSYTLANALVRVYRTLRDCGDTATSQLLTDEDIEACILGAAKRYSTDRPQEMVEDVESDGSRYLPLPADYEDGFSVILAMEFPIDDEPPYYLDSRWVDLYRRPEDLVLRLDSRYVTVPDGEDVRVTYTGRRQFAASAEDTTVLDRDFEAVCDLATSACCDAIAQKYARTHEPVLNADGVAFRDKADVWASRAKRFESRYRDAVGPPIASAVINWDAPASWRGGAWLNHRAVRR